MGLTVGRRQTAQNLTIDGQKSVIFTVNRQRSSYCKPLKWFQGLSNLMISAAHLGLFFGSQRIILHYHAPKFIPSESISDVKLLIFYQRFT